MCNPANIPNPAEQDKQTPRSVSSDIQLANLNLQIANTKANAEYNLSVAGQLQRQFEAMQRVAKPYAESTIVPKSYQGNLGNCIIAIDLAFRLNLPPMAVMQNLYIVNGNPSWSSKFLVATINTCGRFTNIRYRKRKLGPLGKVKYNDTVYDPQKKQKTIVVSEYNATGIDNWECVAYATEKATGEVLESDPVTIEMAIKEGWYTKSGSKWVTMPLLMLTYRAAAFWQRAYAPEVSMGFRTVEEEEDVIDTNYEDLSATAPSPQPSPASSIEKAKDRIRAARSKADCATPETTSTETRDPKTQQS